MKLTRRKNIALGIFFVTANIASAALCWHQFGSPVMPCLNMFAAGLCASEVIDLIIS
jgi:hypothetical protein